MSMLYNRRDSFVENWTDFETHPRGLPSVTSRNNVTHVVLSSLIFRSISVHELCGGFKAHRGQGERCAKYK